MLKKTIRRTAAVVVFCAALTLSRPSYAVNRDMVQLQTQVQQLIDALARLQQSNDQQMGVLKDLVQQDVDAVNKMSTTVSALQLKLQAQSDAQGQRNDQISGQVQALNDSLDELKARMQRMEKSLSDLQSQAQSTSALLGNLPGANGGGATAPPASVAPPAPSTPQRSGAAATDSGPARNDGLATQPAPIAAGGPSANDMYRAAYSDYMAGKYALAGSEFADLIKAHPDDNLAGNAFFYTGEIARRAEKPSVAIKDYDQVLERYPDNAKVPAAHLHKAEALVASKQTEAGIREYRALIQRFPNSPEAAQAHARLSALGVPTAARR
ncbi:MAG TPA: tetratricopeptide repeat protein [Acidobacteriaceae bacterium]|nr:tetratricopeptide repeat protein [Acidobacteriaceae bacterium]